MCLYHSAGLPLEDTDCSPLPFEITHVGITHLLGISVSNIKSKYKGKQHYHYEVLDSGESEHDSEMRLNTYTSETLILLCSDAK